MFETYSILVEPIFQDFPIIGIGYMVSHHKMYGEYLAEITLQRGVVCVCV